MQGMHSHSDDDETPGFEIQDDREDDAPGIEDVIARVSGLPPRQAIFTAHIELARLPHVAGSREFEMVSPIVETWLANPAEPIRLEAMRLAEELEHKGASGLLAASVAWTSGSMVDPRVSHVDPPPDAASHAAAAALAEGLSDLDDELRDASVSRVVGMPTPPRI
jgi:hypothetical protein